MRYFLGQKAAKEKAADQNAALSLTAFSIKSARFAPTRGCAWYQWLCFRGSARTASSGI
ncbi:hypothetical protein HMPREF0239_02104, partial [Clostridium sp. ATCC BAA-442]